MWSIHQTNPNLCVETIGTLSAGVAIENLFMTNHNRKKLNFFKKTQTPNITDVISISKCCIEKSKKCFCTGICHSSLISCCLTVERVRFTCGVDFKLLIKSKLTFSIISVMILMCMSAHCVSVESSKEQFAATNIAEELVRLFRKQAEHEKKEMIFEVLAPLAENGKSQI